ncbi:MAG: hypothetical protein J6Z34_04405 [Clostridia bacterium]|nr:hypothetical protein [Clostridia bacterium]
MNNRITKTRLKQLLSYDLWKIIAIIAAGVFLWSLLFTMFGDSLSEGQKLNVYAYNVTVKVSEMNELLKTGGENDFKSYEIRETQFYDFGMYSASNTTTAQQFAAWSSVGQLDIFFVSCNEGIVTKQKDENGREVETKRSLAGDYIPYFYPLETLTGDAFDYLKRYGGLDADGNLDETEIKNYFLDRKRRDNFYRHGQIDADMEVERFGKLLYAANKMKEFLSRDDLDIWYTAEQDGKEYIYGVEMGKLGLRGGNPATGKTPTDLCGVGEIDEVSGSSVASGVALAVFNNKNHQPDLMYESLSFVVAVIERYSDL